MRRFLIKFVKNFNIDLMMKCCVERVVKGVPKTLQGETGLIIVLNGFDSRKLSLLDPVHQLPWATTFVCDFLDFVVEERLLGDFDCRFEELPIITTSC